MTKAPAIFSLFRKAQPKDIIASLQFFVTFILVSRDYAQSLMLLHYRCHKDLFALLRVL